MKIKLHFHTGDRVRQPVSGWTGTVTKTHNRKGRVLSSGGHQDVIVQWDRTGASSVVTIAKVNLTRIVEAS